MQSKNNNLKMQASFTPQTLADGLGIDIGTLKRAMTRMDFYYGKDDPLPPDVVREILSTYAKPHPRRPEEVVESAQEIAQQFNIQINIGEPLERKHREDTPSSAVNLPDPPEERLGSQPLQIASREKRIANSEKPSPWQGQGQGQRQGQGCQGRSCLAASLCW